MEVPTNKNSQGKKKMKKMLQLEKNEAKEKEVLAMSKQLEKLNSNELEKFFLDNFPKMEMGNKKS